MARIKESRRNGCNVRLFTKMKEKLTSDPPTYAQPSDRTQPPASLHTLHLAFLPLATGSERPASTSTPATSIAKPNG